VLKNLSKSNKPLRSTQPGHHSVGRHNEYRPKGGDALEVKADMVLFAGNTVWSISERVRDICVDALYKSTYTLLYFVMKRKNLLPIFWYTYKKVRTLPISPSSFLTPTVVGGRRPLPPKICTQNDPQLSKNADFDRFPLITFQP